MPSPRATKTFNWQWINRSDTTSSRTDEISNGRRSATTKLLAKSISGKTCPICLCDVEVSTAAVIIPSKHAFCIECIRRWSNRKQNCPLCKVHFNSCFTKIDLVSQTFQKVKLPIEGKTVTSPGLSSPFRPGRPNRLELLRRYQEDLDDPSSPPQIRRSFLKRRNEHPDDIAERVLRWRASIYEKKLRAVRFSDFYSFCPFMTEGRKMEVLERIQPWIRRELHAILGDPDPTVIVHVVTSLFLSGYVEKHAYSFRQWELDPDFYESLLPFLQEKTKIKMFWHELRWKGSLTQPLYPRSIP